jgi:hypothetical protein
MSYNILADLYADSDFSRQNLFPQCPPFALGNVSLHSTMANSFFSVPDPGSAAFLTPGSGIREGKNSDPGCGINILDPQN